MKSKRIRIFWAMVLATSILGSGCGTATTDEASGAGAAPKEEFAGPVALKASNGKFICADQAEGIPRWGALMANRDSVGDWERFELVKHDSSHYALRSANGKYVSAEREGLFLAVADRDSVQDWETFTVVKVADGQIALRTTEGRFFSAEQTEGSSCYLCIVADRTEPGAWERFELVRLDPVR